MKYRVVTNTNQRRTNLPLTEREASSIAGIDAHLADLNATLSLYRRLSHERQRIYERARRREKRAQKEQYL